MGQFNPFPNKPLFVRLCSKSLLKTLWEKEKLLVTSNFSFSPQCFLSFRITFCHFLQTLNCPLQTLSVWKSLQFVIWEMVNQGLQIRESDDILKPLVLFQNLCCRYLFVSLYDFTLLHPICSPVQIVCLEASVALPEWLSGECVTLMTRWL